MVTAHTSELLGTGPTYLLWNNRKHKVLVATFRICILCVRRRCFFPNVGLPGLSVHMRLGGLLVHTVKLVLYAVSYVDHGRCNKRGKRLSNAY